MSRSLFVTCSLLLIYSNRFKIYFCICKQTKELEVKKESTREYSDNSSPTSASKFDAVSIHFSVGTFKVLYVLEITSKPS